MNSILKTLLTNKNAPQSIFSESVVLGGLLLNLELISSLSIKLPKEAFFYSVYQYIYKEIYSLYIEGEFLNLINLEIKLVKNSQFRKMDGIKILNQLMNLSISNTEFNEHVNLLLDLYLKREFLKYLIKMISICYTSSSIYLILKISDLILDNLKNMAGISISDGYKSIESSQELFPQLFSDMIIQSRKKTSFSGICSGYSDFDVITKGLQKQDLIIIAARPGMGKTTLALNILLNIVKEKKTAIFFSLEMSKKELLYKLLSIESAVPTDLLQTGMLNKFEWDKLIKAGQYLQQLPLFIDDSSDLAPNDIKNKINNLKINNLSVIMIDYLQLIQYPLLQENRIKELSFITRSLKSLARSMNVPIIVLSQLSRIVESRLNKRPFLSDLRDSGCIVSDVNLQFIQDPQKMYKIIHNHKKNFLQSFSVYRFSYYFSTKYKYYFSGNKNIYLVDSYTTPFIYVTANHKFFTQYGWKRLNCIEFYDCISMLFYNHLVQIFFKLYKCYSIIWCGKHSTYDVEEDINHNFIANQFLVHNSIEQDADLVCMLYREDYYSTITRSDNDTHNSAASASSITEIHIAKHRKGRTGIFQLEFDMTTSTFKSSF
uniref:Replicative DNA helicase n=1 Tax=Bulboplastis apyrenoidosa TaxID=1070855 RepID=A0A1Y9TM50_9RHOD|nr:replication helicase subunit [Bulboplastis apyrenoidosa]ARO90715.1 replication helicase subunit [Bulboplastis apyrenoidosa]